MIFGAEKEAFDGVQVNALEILLGLVLALSLLDRVLERDKVVVGSTLLLLFVVLAAAAADRILRVGLKADLVPGVVLLVT